MHAPRLLDLCDDDDLAEALPGRHDLQLARRNLRVDCNDPRADRFFVESAFSGPRVFSGLELVRAKAGLAEEHERIRGSFSAQATAGAKGARACRSRGPKTIPSSLRGSSTRADLDGDGRDDRLIEYVIDGKAKYPHYETRLRAEFAGGGPVIDVDTGGWRFIDGFYGATDLDRNGRDEVWYEPNTNKPGAVGLMVFESCQVTTVTEDTTEFLVHMYPRFMETVGLHCDDAGRVLYTWSTPHVDDPYGSGRDVEEKWFFNEMQLDGTQLVPIGSGGGDLLRNRPSEIDWRGGFDCARTHGGSPG
jgi:hypothetical protein